MNGTPVSSGMGTCGFVGQIGVYSGWINDIANGSKTAITSMDWIGLVLICFILPAVLCPLINMICRKLGWVKDGDLMLDRWFGNTSVFLFLFLWSIWYCQSWIHLQIIYFHPSHHLFFTSCVVECIGLIGNQNEKQKEQKENISQQICIQKPFPVQG